MAPDAQPSSDTFERISIRCAEMLALVANGYRQRKIAEQLGIAYTTVRSRVVDAENITGATNMRELQRWWTKWRFHWLARVAERGGFPTGMVELIRETGEEPYSA